jgi:hypothetical protein
MSIEVFAGAKSKIYAQGFIKFSDYKMSINTRGGNDTHKKNFSLPFFYCNMAASS